MSLSQWTTLAHLIRPQGRHGEILADILTDFPERFAERKRLFLVASGTGGGVLPAREITLEKHWLHKDRIVLKFDGVDSINDAEALRGFDVVIPFSERAELDAGSVYISDLIGCEVVDVAGGEISVGTIADVDREASLLVVRAAKGAEHLIPFAQAYLVNLDVTAKRVEMRLPEGLLEIDAPVTDKERSELEQPGHSGNDE